MRALYPSGFVNKTEATATRHNGSPARYASSSCRFMGRTCGFTMVELMVTIIIVGILAVSIGPRFFELDAFRARGFYDETLAVLHYAQKTAIAQRRAVYVRLDGATETVTACYTSVFPCAAVDQVPGPYGEKPYTITAADGVDLQVTGTYFFDALGRPYNASDIVPTSTFTALTISIVGGGDARAITVERETGYAR